jgi:hypothetical protein
MSGRTNVRQRESDVRYSLLRSHAKSLRSLRRGRDPCHPSAFFGAAPARVGTGAAVIVLVSPTLLTTRLAGVGTQRADLMNELTFPRHVPGGEAADCGAIHVQPDTLDHHLHFLFRQAGGCAVVARIRAKIARLDAGPVLLVCHRVAPRRRRAAIVVGRPSDCPSKDYGHKRANKFNQVRIHSTADGDAQEADARAGPAFAPPRLPAATTRPSHRRA